MTASRGAIVVGVGDTAGSVRELDWAAREARARRRPLHLVRAWSRAAAALPWDSAVDRTIQRELRTAAEHRLADAVTYLDTNWPGVEHTCEAVEGVAAYVLVEQSTSGATVVLGSHNRGPVGSLMLGSVGQVVAARAAGPVVIVAGAPGADAEGAGVVVGVDGSAVTRDALAYAFDVAAVHGVPVRPVFCYSPDLLAAAQWRSPHPAPERADRWLAEVVAGWQEKYPDVQVHRGVVREHPVSGLVEASHAQELLVVGSHGGHPGRHPHLASLLGSVAQGVLHHATCPVAVVHPSD